MWHRLRQITVLASDTRRTVVDLATVLGLEACCTDPMVEPFRLKDTVFPLGNQFIDVVTPLDADTAGARYLRRRGGDTGYVVTTQTGDIAGPRSRATELGVRITLTMDRPHDHLVGIQLHPADVGGALWEIDQMNVAGAEAPDGPWGPAGPYWRPFVRTDHVSAILVAELQSADPAALAARWAHIAGRDVGTDPAGNPLVTLDDGALRFVAATDGRGDGLGGIDVRVVDRAAVLDAARARGCYRTDDLVVIAGLRINLIP